MLPYVTLNSTQVFGFKLYLFPVLVATGLLTGFALAIRQGGRHGLSRERIALLAIFVIVSGLLGARLGYLLYEPDLLRDILTRPAFVFSNLRGISSFGGYFGGLAGGLLFFRLHCSSLEERLRFLDAVGFALPFGWFLGRVGCALVHDHPGILSAGWLTVAYPDGPRYDLGLLEAFFLLFLASVFAFLNRRARRPGFYYALYFSLYGPFRVFLDQLRVDPPRYFGWSVDQYCGTLAAAVGLVTWFLMARSVSSPQFNSEISHGISHNPVAET